MLSSFFLAAALAATALPASAAEPLSASHPYGPHRIWLDNGTARARLVIEPGAYAYRNKLGLLADGAPLRGLSSPAGRVIEDPAFGAVEALEGSFEISAPAPSGARLIQSVDQVCSAAQGVCYPARALEFDTASGATRELDAARAADLARRIEGASAPLSWRSPVAPAPSPAPLPAETNPQSPSARQEAFSTTSADYFSYALSGAPGLALGVFFIAGILLSMTPCNWPVLPLVARSLSASATGERLSFGRKASLLASYILTFGLAYAALGALAAAAGSALAAFLASTSGTLLVASALAAMGLSSLGLFELRLPTRLGSIKPGARRARSGPVLTAAGNGLLGALLASPCVAAPLAGALVFSAASGSLLFACLALFFMALGLCSPLALIALAGSSGLPKSGPWTAMARQLIGWLTLWVAAFWASPALPGPIALALVGFVTLGSAAFILTEPARSAPPGAARSALASFGVCLGLLGACQVIGATAGASNPLAPMELFAERARSEGEPSAPIFQNAERLSSPKDLDRFLAQSAARGDPAAILATADWCANCKALERSVLRLPRSALGLDGFALATADFSSMSEPQAALMRRLALAGPPALLLYAPGSREPGRRLSGLFDAPEIAKAAKGLALKVDKSGAGA